MATIPRTTSLRSQLRHIKLRSFSNTLSVVIVLLLLLCIHPAATHSETQLHPQQLKLNTSVRKFQHLGGACRGETPKGHSRRLNFSPAEAIKPTDKNGQNRTDGPGKAPVEVGLLGPDGSISEAYLLVMGLMALEDLSQIPVETATTIPNRTDLSRELEVKEFVPCKESLRDAIPSSREKDPSKGKGASCVVMVPPNYVRQYKWPQSQLKARPQNVPNVPLLLSPQAQAWVHVNASAIIFLPGGPMYPNGADAYLDHLVQLVPELGFGVTTRAVLDVGGGTGSLSRALEQREVATLCVAPYGSLEDAVQLLMERGYPGLLTHSFSSLTRLPYPSQAFDMLHCAACNISWSIHDGALLFEADRILRRGGFFVWKSDASNHGPTWPEMELQAAKVCWKLMTRDDQIGVWRKPTNITTATDCINRPPSCPSVPGPDAAWKVDMKPCLENTGAAETFVATANRTFRLINPPPRLQTVPAAGLHTAKQEAFIADLNYWVYLTDFYVRLFGPSRMAEVRNVLDVNAGYGGFAAALALRTPPVPWWVLSVVPVDGPNRLPVIVDRGLLGLHHDWYVPPPPYTLREPNIIAAINAPFERCEALDSYPRTFDLVHASGFFSAKHRCSMRVMLQEMDRLLRPGGFALFRDHKLAILKVQRIVKALHWKTHVDDTESGPMGTDKLLHCQKTKWTKRPKV